MYSRRGWSYSRQRIPNRSSYRRSRRRRGRGGGFLSRLGRFAFAVLVGGTAAWYFFLFAGLTVEGVVLDRASGRALSGARVWSGAKATVTGLDGRFQLNGVKLPVPLSLDAPGYLGTSLWPFGSSEALNVGLDPVTVDLLVTDSETGQPISDAAASAGLLSATALGEGRLRLAPVQAGDRLLVRADGYKAREVPYSGQAFEEVALAPSLIGRVTDAYTGKGIPHARLGAGEPVAVTDEQGSYELPSRPANGRVVALVPGYKRAQIDLQQQRSLDLQLRPNEVKALYMTYFAIGQPDYRQRMNELLDNTELNAVVIDVKGDYGYLAYRSNVPLAEQVGANDNPTVEDVEGLLKSLHDRGVYAIARIVVFKDNLLARNGPRAGLDVSIKDRRRDGPWVDGENLAWVDAFQPAAGDYNIALAREAIVRGFDEVQFDYIRFPTDPSPGGSVEDTQYSKPFTQSNRVEALRDFLSRAHRAVNEAGGFLGIDTFGYTTWWEDDGGIGQDLGVLADHVDYFCPMVYPSTYGAGLPGLIPFPDVVQMPYEVVSESLKKVQEKLAGKTVVVRPWLQYFDDYPWATSFHYDAAQIEAQKQAVADARAYGWMLWNPGSLYDRGGLAPKRQDLVAAGP
jgi:hypothetical protein